MIETPNSEELPGVGNGAHCTEIQGGSGRTPVNISRKSLLAVAAVAILAGLALVGLGNALIPLLIAFVLAYLLFPVILQLERKGFKRQYSVPMVLLVILIVAAGAIALIVPGLVSDAGKFLQELPQISSQAIEKLEKLTVTLGFPLELSRQEVSEFVLAQVSDLSTESIRAFTLSLRGAFSDLLDWALTLLSFFLLPLFFFYVINDYERITREIQSLFPQGMQPVLERYARECDKVLSGYIRGQLCVAGILGVLYGIGLSLTGLRFGFLIGITTGVLSIVPYAGFTFGFVTALMVALANFDGPATVAGVVAVFLVVQLADGLFITPRMVGNQVGLSSLATLLALIVFGNLLGLVGMFLAIPAAAMVKFLVKDLKEEYQGHNAGEET